jgi:hypothetical protein
MNNIIEALDSMASNAKFNSSITIQELIQGMDVNEEQAKAILNKNIPSLKRQLDICPDIYCILFPAEEENPEESEKPAEDKENNQSVINI